MRRFIPKRREQAFKVAAFTGLLAVSLVVAPSAAAAPPAARARPRISSK